MLFLLRNIRRKLMEKHKVTTYLLYAIGEILLVVIGILIAVQIDNWNQNRKDRKAERQYLVNLVADLELQMSEVQGCITSEGGNVRYIREIGKQIESGLVDVDVELISVQLTRCMLNRSLNKYDATFEELKATGNIGLISNETLKTDVISYYQALDRSSLVLEKYEYQLNNTLINQLLAADLLNFNIQFDLLDVNKNLGNLFLIKSGEPIDNPIVDSLAAFNFQKMTIQNLKSPEGAFRLKNVLSARHFGILVALVNFKQIKDDTEKLKRQIELELNTTKN